MNKFPKVSIVVLNYNGRDVILECLGSLFRLSYPNFDVVLVDNASTDGSLELARKNFSRCNFIKNEENLGFAAGNNVGIRFALEKMADYVLLLNNDTQVQSDFLSRLIEEGEKEEKIGILSPLIYQGKTKEIWFSGGRIDWWKMKTEHDTILRDKTVYDSPFITGCAMLIKKAVFQKIGLLDEDFFLYWEDADFVTRARKAGFETVVVQDSCINHLEKSEETKKNKVYWLVISGLIFFQKNSQSFWQRAWLKFYLVARKLKNRYDLRDSENQLAQAVSRAYRDFGKL